MEKYCYFKNIRLIPTLFSVDVWVCNDLSFLSRQFNKRYGASIECYEEEITKNQVCKISSTIKSELKGRTAIVMNVETFNHSIIIHELMHVVFKLSKMCDIEVSYDSQEWVSYFIEYLFDNCIDKKTYKKLK